MTRQLLPCAVVLAVSLPLFAEDEGFERGVARISLINGDVSMRRGDSGDWTSAAPNAPLVVGDALFTGAASRAEVQFDYANMIRVAPDAEVRLSELEYRRYQVQLARGMVTVSVLRSYEDTELDISTPSVSVRPLRKGLYRIHVREDGSTEIAVRDGEAEIYSPRGMQRLRHGRTMLVRGTTSDPEFQMIADLPDDDWDRWNEARDRQLERSDSYRYVSRDVYGAEDLYGHGTWVHIAPYGYVWQPYVSIGWAPYRYGRWGWLDYYGWTWISYDPWGWAPYHYGRWFYHGTRWCWWPGGYYSRHYWRPALVGFFGWGRHGGFGIGIGFGRVGWVPLAPYEVYRPWYGRHIYGGYRNRTYIDNSVNIVNNVNINNVYRNGRVRNGLTVVDGRDFSQGRVNHISALNDNELRRASLVQGQVPVVPDRASLRFADREARQVASNRSADARFYSRREPSRVERVSFEDQRNGIEQYSRRSFGEPATRSARSEAGGRAEAPVESRGATGGAGSRAAMARGDESRAGRTAEQTTDRTEGWRRFGEPVRSQTEATRSSEPARSSESGWRRVGEPSSRAAETAPSRSAPESDRGGWRRFGEPVRSAEPAGGSNREAAPGSDTGRRAESDRGAWRRMSEATPQSDRSGDGGFSQRRSQSSDDGWRSLGSRRSAEESPRRSEGSPRFERGAPSSSRSEGRSSGSESRRMDSPRSEQPVRISPPIVRERSSPRSSGNFDRSSPSGRFGGFGSSGSVRSGGSSRSSGGFGGFGGGGRISGSSPSRSSGGRTSGGGGGVSGGGGGRVSGGGGGGGRSSGGSSGRSSRGGGRSR